MPTVSLSGILSCALIPKSGLSTLLPFLTSLPPPGKPTSAPSTSPSPPWAVRSQRCLGRWCGAWSQVDETVFRRICHFPGLPSSGKSSWMGCLFHRNFQGTSFYRQLINQEGLVESLVNFSDCVLVAVNYDILPKMEGLVVFVLLLYIWSDQGLAVRGEHHVAAHSCCMMLTQRSLELGCESDFGPGGQSHRLLRCSEPSE